jgi:hypothetical protein
MRSRRIITPILAWLVALSAAIPATAAAGPLLSGYGGPGQGNQAILGSSLLGGGGGSSGGGGPQSGGGSSGGEGLSHASVSTAASAPSTPGTHKNAVHKGRPGGSVDNTAAGGRAVTSRAGGGPGVFPASSRGAASQASGSETLGLSGENITYVLLALLALVATGVLTRRIARSAGRAGTGS